MIKAKDNFLVIETSKTSLILEIRDFDDPLTPFNKGKKFVSQYYYGFSNECPDLVPSIANIPGHGSTNDYNRNLLISSTYGNGNQKEPLLLIKNLDNTFINRFFYKEYKIFKGPKEMKGPHTRDVLETLEIVEVDDLLNIELHHYYSIVKDLDIIISKKEIRNLNKKDCNVCRLFSLELPIKSTDLSVQTFDGTWLYERSRHVTNVTSGASINQDTKKVTFPNQLPAGQYRRSGLCSHDFRSRIKCRLYGHCRCHRLRYSLFRTSGRSGTGHQIHDAHSFGFDDHPRRSQLYPQRCR